MQKIRLPFALLLALSIAIAPMAEAVQHLKRTPKLEEIRLSEPEVATYVDSWYDQLDAQIEMLIQSRAHWQEMRASGELNQEDYEMVYKRDYTDRLLRLKAAIPELAQMARDTIKAIRNNEVTLLSYNEGVHGPTSYNHHFEIKRNGEVFKNEQLIKSISTKEVAELEALIAKLKIPEVIENPPLGSSWKNITIFQKGAFFTYDQYQSTSEDHQKLIERALELSAE